MERLVVWHRVVPPTREVADDLTAVDAWAQRVTHRMRAAGGTVLAAIGASVAVGFDPPDLADALDLCLTLLDEAEQEELPPGGPKVAFGAAMGAVSEREGVSVGAAIDRAQLLANRARPGELVLDAESREAASTVFLFSRVVGAGAQALKGTALDRGHPRRAECRSAITHLHPPTVPPITEEALAPVRETAARGGLIVLRGPAGAGAGSFLGTLRRALEPSLVLRLAGVPGALEPLGSLRLSLLRRWPEPSDLDAALGDDPPGRALRRVARGEVSALDETSASLRRVLRREVTTPGGPPWVILDPVAGIDPASIAVVSRALDDPDLPVTIIARLGIDAQLPEALRTLPDPLDLVIPALRAEDARAIAKTVLGTGVDDEVVRRVAVLGGDTSLGVVEAARALVAAGDLIHDGEHFAWRVGPRAGIRGIPVEALLEERLKGLEERPSRMLEAICVVPESAPARLADRVAALDGLDDDARKEAVRHLRREAYLHPRRHAPSSTLLRTLVVQHMPPARLAELYRFLAKAMKDPEEEHGTFAQGTIGYYLSEGGHPAEGAAALLAAGLAAVRGGYPRAAVRLAAAAVQFHPTEETKNEASHITRLVRGSVRPTAPPPSVHDTVEIPLAEAIQQTPAPPELDEPVSKVAVEALLSGDFETVDRCLETAIAEGRDLAAADRLRAMAALARGDLSMAMDALARVRLKDHGDPRRVARDSLTLSWVLLHRGEAVQAVRAGLTALGASRKLKDPRGEAAAMHTLSACYRALGRPDDAEAIEDASPA